MWNWSAESAPSSHHHISTSTLERTRFFANALDLFQELAYTFLQQKGQLGEFT